MKLIERLQCAVTGARDLEPLHEFKDFPVFMGCVDTPFEQDVKVDMAWSISRSSGLIQLRYLLPLDVLYQASHGSGAVGALWERHHSEFASFISQFAPRNILEVGGGHGVLASKYCNSVAGSQWTIVEPNPSPVPGCPATFYKGFFDGNFVPPNKVDAFVHSHVFEHIYEPHDFVKNIARILEKGDLLIFSIPNMQVMLERMYTNCINFEHTIFLTEPYIEFLLSNSGFRLIEKKYFLDDHSIFYAWSRSDHGVIPPLRERLYDENRRLYLQYIKYHQDLVSDLNECISNSKGPVFLFGGHVFSQYLINMGLNAERIIGILDNDTRKHGRRLYGTRLIVSSPKVLAGLRNVSVILKAGVYNEEIRADIVSNINSTVLFLE